MLLNREINGSRKLIKLRICRTIFGAEQFNKLSDLPTALKSGGYSEFKAGM